MKISDFTNFLGLTNTKAKEARPAAVPQFDERMEGERKVLFSWTADERTPHGFSNPKSNRTFLVIASVVALLLVVMREAMLLVVVASIFFLRNILSSTSPKKLTHTITTHGVMFSEQFFSWNELRQFFFKKTKDTDILCIDTAEAIPGRLFFLTDVGEKEKIVEILNKYLPYLEEEPKNFMDRVYDSASNRISFEGAEDNVGDESIQ